MNCCQDSLVEWGRGGGTQSNLAQGFVMAYCQDSLVECGGRGGISGLEDILVI